MRTKSDKFRFLVSLIALMAILALTFSFKPEPKGKIVFERKGKTIKIVNKSDFDIHHIYITGNNNASWGSDILGNGDDDLLSKGETQEIELPDCGKWDVKIVAADGNECIVYDVDLCANSLWEADC